MAEATVEQLNAVIESDPQLQQQIATLRANPQVASGRPSGLLVNAQAQMRKMVSDRLAQQGLTLPHDIYASIQHGDIRQLGWLGRNADWFLPLLMGGAVTAGVLTAPTAAVSGTGATTATTGGSVATEQALNAANQGKPPGSSLLSSGLSTADTIRKIAQIGAPIGGALLGKSLSNTGAEGSAEQNPQLQELLSMAIKRISDQQPLQDAVNRQALGGLPTYAKG